MASGLGAVPVAVMRREMRFKPLALRSLYGRLAGVLIAFVTIWMGWGIWSLVAQHLAQICLATILVWQASTWRPRFVFSSRRLAELLRFGVFSVGSRFLWVSSSRLFVLFVGNLAGLAAAGFVSVAFRLVDTLFDLLASAADNFALPLFSRLQHDPRALFRAYCTATELTTLVTLPLFVGLSIGTDPIVRVLLGEDWLAAVPLVQWLALSAGLQFFLLFTHTALNAVGRPGVIFVATAASLGFVAVMALLAQPTEALSATIIWALRILVGGPILIVVLLRVLGAAPDVLLATIWRPVAVTAPMAVFVFFLNKAVWPSQDAMLQLAILIAAGAMTYGVSLALYARPALRRMLSFVVGTRPAPDSSAGAIRNETATT